MPPTKLPLLRVMLIGLVLPVGVALLDRWLLARELSAGRHVASAQAMIAFVLQVGLYGILCGRLIELPWLRWFLFAWCLLFTDLNAASSLDDRIPQSLFTAQIGLVTVWAVLGTQSWKIRLPVVLLLIVPLLATIAQTAALCLICLVLRSQRYCLAHAIGDGDARNPADPAPPASRSIQFGIRDVLLWTTALAPLLAVARLGAWLQLADGSLHAIVLVAALWAALGQGPAWLRWLVVGLFALLAGTIAADFYIYVARYWWWPPPPPSWFSVRHFEFLWWRFTEPQGNPWLPFFLAAGMLTATLLIYRVVGYRLCRLPPEPSQA
jgi:hypothetical protein